MYQENKNGAYSCSGEAPLLFVFDNIILALMISLVKHFWEFVLFLRVS
jgi:hypothetical protein